MNNLQPFIRRPINPKSIKSVNAEADACLSVTQQTPWRCEIFDFGKAQLPGTDYFNSALVERPDGLWLVARRCVWDKQISIGRNDLMAFLLDPVTYQPKYGRKITLHKSFSNEHFEDPRAVIQGGKVFVTACNFVIEIGRGWTGAHQAVFELNNDWQQVKRFDPDYGMNGHAIGRNKGNEKNWLVFWHDNLPHMVYAATPHIVVVFDEAFKPTRVWTTENAAIDRIWKWGTIRGGTPPVLVGDEYWTFFHSSMEWRADKKRWYVMGAYAFESKPPFKITRVTRRYLLAGSRFDRWAEGKPLVVFPCGAIFRDGKWMVTGGINDLDSFWIEIPHDELLERTVEV